MTLSDDEHWVAVPDQAPSSETQSLVDSPGDRSWIGLRAFQDEPATFEAGVEPVASDQWADEVPTDLHVLPPEEATVQQAEALAARGELGAALGLYQDLAESNPNDPRLWQRIEELAKALQRQSTPP